MHDEVYAEPDLGVDPIALSWAAGLFEGEGCFTISTNSRTGYRQPRIKLNSTDRDVVDRFASAMGVGQIRAENCQVKRGWKQQWEWYVSSRADIRDVIGLLWPYLGNRRMLRAIDLLALIDGPQ